MNNKKQTDLTRLGITSMYSPLQYKDDHLEYIVLHTHIIDKCNFNCYYCFNEFPRTGIQLDLMKYLNFLIHMYKRLKKNIRVVVCGGEPTLHPDLLKLCKMCNNIFGNKVTFDIFSNFSSDIQLYIDLLQLQNCSLCLSYHSINGKKNQSYVDKMLKLPTQYTDKVEITVMYEQFCIENSIEVFNDLIKRFPRNINLVHVLSPNYVYDKRYEYNEYQLQKFDELIFNNKDLMEKRTYDFYCYDTYNSKNNMLYSAELLNPIKTYNHFKYWKCNAGIDQLYIHCNGDIAICEDVYFELKRKISNIYSSSALNLELKPNICPLSECGCPYISKKTRVFKNDI